MDQDKSSWARPVLAGVSVAMLLGLGACGGRTESPSLPPPVDGHLQKERVQVKAEPVDTGNVVMTMRGDPPPLPREAVVSEDADIEDQVHALLRKDQDLGGVKIDVHARDGVVTLRGMAPDATARDRASQLVQGIRKVKTVDNQLTLG